MKPLSFNQLKGIPSEGGNIEGPSGDDDFLGKINSIITGINTLFVNYQQLRGNVTAQSQGVIEGKGDPGNKPLTSPDSQVILKAVDQRLFQLVTKTFSNRVFNMPISQLINDYGDKTVVQAMEDFAKEGEK